MRSNAIDQASMDLSEWEGLGQGGAGNWNFSKKRKIIEPTQLDIEKLVQFLT